MEPRATTETPASPPPVVLPLVERFLRPLEEDERLFFFVSIFFFQTATAATSFVRLTPLLPPSCLPHTHTHTRFLQVVMEHEAAWIALGIYVVGSYIWYKYCIRIYNRFKVRSVGFAWKDDEDEDQRPEARRSDESAPSIYSFHDGGGLVRNSDGSVTKPKKHNSLLGRLARMGGTHGGELT